MQKQPASPKALKLAQVAFAAASCLLVAGVIFGGGSARTSSSSSSAFGFIHINLRFVIHESGFAALKPVLVHEGIYDELCDTKRDAGQARRTGRPCLGQDLQVYCSPAFVTLSSPLNKPLLTQQSPFPALAFLDVCSITSTSCAPSS